MVTKDLKADGKARGRGKGRGKAAGPTSDTARLGAMVWGVSAARRLQELDGHSVEAESNFEILRAQRAQARKGRSNTCQERWFRWGQVEIELISSHFRSELGGRCGLAEATSSSRTFVRTRAWMKTTP